MIIVTSQEFALVSGDCCPCLPPEAPQFRKDCQSRFISLTSYGFFKDVGDVIWTIYKSVTQGEASSSSFSESGTEGFITFGQTYTCEYELTTTQEASSLVEWSDGCSDNGAQSKTLTCTNSLFSTETNFRKVEDDGIVFEDDRFSATRTRIDLSGTPNPEHAEWQAAVDEWDSLPEEEREGDRPIEPPEFYPECTFIDEVTEESTTVDGNAEGFPRTYFDSALDSCISFSGGTHTFTVTPAAYNDGINYETWVAQAKVIVNSQLKFQAAEGEDEIEAECFSDECSSNYQVDPEPLAPPPEPTVEGEDPPPTPTAPKRLVNMRVTKARYRIGIPSGDTWKATTAEWIAWDNADPATRGDEPLKTSYDVAYAAWQTAKTAWLALPLAERGPEPIEPIPRTFYAWQGDEVFFPKEWEDWKALKDAFDTATAAREAWVADGSQGPEPNVPDDPGEEPTPTPSLVASRSWTYGGTDEWSPWWEIPLPETPGETRLVNQRARHYRSARLGNKPTAFGEVHEL